MKNIGLRLFVNLNPLNRKERYDAAKGAKNPSSLPQSGWSAWFYFPPITSLAMVANCMLDVPS